MPRFILFAVFFNFTAVAMENEQGARIFHELYFKRELIQFSKEQFENLKPYLAATISGDPGPELPSPNSAGFSNYISADIKDNERIEKIPLPELEKAMKDLSRLVPFSIVMTLPQIMTTMGYVSIKYIFDGIDKNNVNEIFYHQISLHLYHWINFVKLGRQAIIDELCRNKGFLIDPKLTPFDAHINKALLGFIDDALLNYEEKWHEISARVKIPFSDRQMINIRARLSSLSRIYKEMADFSIDDMDKYIDFALYCFAVSKEHHLSAAIKYATSDRYLK